MYLGIILSNGDSWKEMRRFALTNLRDFGMGKKMSEEKIIQECHYLIDTLEKHEGNQINYWKHNSALEFAHCVSNVLINCTLYNLVPWTLFITGKAFDSTQAVNYAASNVISAIVYGDRFEYTDPVFQAMVNRDNETIHLTGSAAIQV